MRIGLTGSIGAGKSAVSARLRELGAYIVDADIVAREVVEIGGAGFEPVAEAFGQGVLTAEGRLDRAALAALVFTDERKRAQLNAILHPLILERMWRMAEESGAARVVFDVPLLFECGMDADMDAVWLVDAPRELRIARIMARDGMSREQAEARIAAQLPDEEKRRRGAMLIINDGMLAELYRKVDALWESTDAPSS